MEREKGEESILVESEETEDERSGEEKHRLFYLENGRSLLESYNFYSD